jgi:hypothetical protein
MLLCSGICHSICFFSLFSLFLSWSFRLWFLSPNILFVTDITVSIMLLWWYFGLVKIDFVPILYLPFLALFLSGIMLEAFNFSVWLCVFFHCHKLSLMNLFWFIFFDFSLYIGIASLKSCTWIFKHFYLIKFDLVLLKNFCNVMWIVF